MIAADPCNILFLKMIISLTRDGHYRLSTTFGTTEIPSASGDDLMKISSRVGNNRTPSLIGIPNTKSEVLNGYIR